jgi:hypothetical protein
MEPVSLTPKDGRSGRVISISAAREAVDLDVGLSNACVWSVGASSKAIGYDFMDVAPHTTCNKEKFEVISNY